MSRIKEIGFVLLFFLFSGFPLLDFVSGFHNDSVNRNACMNCLTIWQAFSAASGFDPVDAAGEKRRLERPEIRSQSYLNQGIRVDDVAANPYSYVGRSIEWEGVAVFSDSRNGLCRYYVNSNQAVKGEENMNFMFGIIFPQSLPIDPRISIYSTRIIVKGKIIGVEKLFNHASSTSSSRRQPIVEASEVTFIRENYEQPLVIQFF